MTHLHKLRLYPVLRWVSSSLSLNFFKSPKYPIYNVHSCYRSFGDVAEVNENNGKSGRRYLTVRKKVEAALLDYLYFSRSLLFADAEHMSKNSPCFVKKLVDKFRYESDVRRSMRRFLNYHPINEFEPFFESIGLGPSEFDALLPRNLMFLSDEVGLLDNYHVLCEYGIDRPHIGKIYREARNVFRYDQGVLQSKLQAFEGAGISKDVVSRAVSFNPTLLSNGMSEEFFELVRKLKCLGFENCWVEQKFEMTTYNWRQISHLLQLFQYLGCNDEDISKLVGRYPGILFDHSGRPALLLIGFVLKFGSSRSDICSIFLRFPQVKIEKFVWNLRRAFELLFEIEMDVVNIGRIIREHFTWIGTCSLKKASWVFFSLGTGRTHMRQIIMANPLELKKWTLGGKIERLPETREMRSRRDKIKFLTSIGFIENSKEIEKPLMVLRGKGDDLRERFDCLVKAGLSECDVAKILIIYPHILNQKIEVLEAKISVVVNDLGYPVSIVRTFPGLLLYTMDRVKLRCAVFRWLIDQNVVPSTLALSTIIGFSESRFINKFVNRHPLGPEVWQEYKQILSI
ncbi:transcription termination factor MTEF18, mitochondrial-like [Silene latifolia]|uniref:transcription termination factor MTEF18, mitochondrial-like n=1 Tax=Silene latifolia TaxID=37657 RepID=UPI003D78286F